MELVTKHNILCSTSHEKSVILLTNMFRQASDDNASGIHFTAGPRRKASSTSISSMAGSMNRVNTVVSSLKKLFSREDSRNSGPLTPDGWLRLNISHYMYFSFEFFNRNAADPFAWIGQHEQSDTIKIS